MPGLGRRALPIEGVRHPKLPDMSSLAAGLVVNMDVSRVDGFLGTIVAVQAGLALRTPVRCGSADQIERWLHSIARGEVRAAFALTEPDHGSYSRALETAARCTATGRRILAAKRWIGQGPSGGITFVWARVDDPDSTDHAAVRCFLVPQDTWGTRAPWSPAKGRGGPFIRPMSADPCRLVAVRSRERSAMVKPSTRWSTSQEVAFAADRELSTRPSGVLTK